MGKIKEKAFWIAIGDFSGRGLSFIASIYLARVLGTEYFGLIAVAISILGYATWGADLGLLNIGVRESARKPAERQYRTREIFNLKVFLGAAVLILSSAILMTIPIGFIQKQVILGYIYSLIPYALLIEWFYSGKQEFGKVALSKIVNGSIYLGLIYWLVNSSSDVTLVPILYTIGVTSAVVVLGTFSLINSPFPLPSRNINVYINLLKSSSTIGFGSLFANIVQLLPPIMIGVFLSLSEAGIYGASFRIIIIAMMLDRIFVNLLLPNLSSIWSTDKGKAIKSVKKVLRLTLVGGCLMAFIVAINSRQIILLLFGDQFLESILILQILSVFILLTFLNSLFSFGLIATNNDRDYFKATCTGGSVAALIIVSCSIFGSSELVATSVVIAECILTLSSYFWFRKVMPISLFKISMIMIGSTFSLFILLTTFDIHHLVSSLIGTSLILIISFYSGVLKSEELSWFREKLLK